MRHKLALATLFLVAVLTVIVCGCVSGVQSSPYSNAVAGKEFYDLNNLSYWKYAITMSAGGANSTWNMTVNDTRNTGAERYMTIGTVGNGMDIMYDIWWNATTYQISQMHARGWIGDDYQDKNVSTLQVFTLPDTGLTYYFVPFQYAGNTTVKGANGVTAPAYVYTATDNKGFSVTYWVHTRIPLPIKVEMASRDFKITMMLVDYR